MKTLSICIIFVLLIVGCATIENAKYMATETADSKQINDRYTFVVVKTRDILSPATTTVMVYDKQSGTFDKVEGGSGASALSSLAGPAATAYAGYQIGRGIRKQKPDTTTVNNNSATKSAAGAAAASKAVQGQGMIQGQGQSQGQTQGQNQLQGQAQELF